MQIEVEKLTKKYGDTIVLDNISFTIETGEIIGFLGPNGAGKTTTLRIITGFLAPTSGNVKINGVDIFYAPLESRKKIGYLPENNPLYQEMKIFEYLSFMAKAKGILQATDEIRRVVKVCGLGTRIGQTIGELSKGYRQRVGIAQSLLGDPDIIIMDEPTSGLDPNQIIEIRNLIREIGGEKTVILSTHILSEVEATCNRFLIIHKGKILSQGKSDELPKFLGETLQLIILVSEKKSSFESALANIVGVRHVSFSNDDTSAAKYIIDVEKSYDIRKEIFSACNQNDLYLLGLEQKRQSLEDIFRLLTK